MEPVLPGLAQPTGRQAAANTYRHLRPIYFPYPGMHCLAPDFRQADYVEEVSGKRLPGGGLRLMLGMLRRGHAHEIKRYHAALLREAALQGALFGGLGRLQQWDFGALPRLFSNAQLAGIVACLHSGFAVASQDAGTFSFTCDPTSGDPGRLAALRGLGFNELSIPLPPHGHDQRMAELVAAARGAAYRAVQIVIPDGLARQNGFLLARRLQDASGLAPDRLALRGQTLQDLHIRLLADAGYQPAGVDLFVHIDSDWRLSQLVAGQRRFPQGDCRLAGPNLLGIGLSAISMLGAHCSLNTGALDEYCQHAAGAELPIARGGILSREQLLRRTVMQMLLCDFELSIAAVEEAFAIDFHARFRQEIELLECMREDGLLALDGGWITISRRGRPWIRHICAVFAQDGDSA